MDVIEKARVFAIAAHSAVKQLRKYTHEPYWVHPVEVANMVANIPNSSDAMIAAAFLHDTVEDTGVTIEVIKEVFGEEIANLVGWLTNVSKPTDGNRAKRKAIDREYIEKAPAEAQTVKCCDIISNLNSIVAHDIDFAMVYIKEVQELCNVLTRAHPAILVEANVALTKSKKTLCL